MSIISKTAVGSLLAAAFVVSLTSTQASAEVKPRIAVPSEPAGVSGCFEADRDLYGPYQLRFCVSKFGGGSYRVTGGNLNCRGSLNWSETWGTYRFQMSRSHCGNGTDWTADTFTCRVIGKFDGGKSSGLSPKIAVPTPAGGTLACTYKPAVWGYASRSFRADRG